jgi:hypothetical protein
VVVLTIEAQQVVKMLESVQHGERGDDELVGGKGFCTSVACMQREAMLLS